MQGICDHQGFTQMVLDSFGKLEQQPNQKMKADHCGNGERDVAAEVGICLRRK